MDFSAKMLRDDALANKVIVVTGGGSGLGKAMTQYFLELGARVAITSRDLDKLQNTASAFRSSNRRKIAWLFNVTCATIHRLKPCWKQF